MNLKKRLIIFTLLLLLIAGTLSAKVTTTDVACSGIDSISINQVYVPSGSQEGYIELYVNTNQNIRDWQIYYEGTALNVLGAGTVYRNGIALVSTQVVQAGDYIIFNENDFGGNNNAFGQSDGEVLLIDDSGYAVHYVRYFNNNNKWYWNTPADCATSYDQGNASGDGVCSIPDGSLDENNWEVCGDSKGSTNASCPLGHFTITQEDFALSCPDTRALVTIVPYCSDGTTIKTDYDGIVDLSSDSTGSQFYSSSTGGSPISSITFTAGSGMANIYLYNNQEEVVHVTATDTAPDPDISATGNGTDFRAYGFRTEAALSSLICGNPNNVTVTAYGKTNNSAGQSCAIITGFAGSKELKVWLEPYYIDSGTAAGSNNNIELNNIILPDAEPGSNNISNINFINGQASLDVLWDDAGRVILHVKHDDYPYNGALGAAFDAEHRAPLQDDTGIITLRPEAFDVQATLTDNITVLNNIDPLVASPVLKAGSETFNVTVTAKCANDVTAPNFASVVQLSTNAPDFTSTGSLAPVASTFESTVSGVASFNNLSYDEVGHFTLTADTTETYLDTGLIISGSFVTGRFVPDHFYLDSYSVAPEAAWTCDFSYLGQPNIAINYTIQALAGGAIPTVTQNYHYALPLTDNHAKAVFEHVLEDDNKGTAADIPIERFIQSPMTLLSLKYANDRWVNGEYLLSGLYAFTRNADPDGAFEPLRLGIMLTNDDEAGVDIELANTLDMNAATADNCTAVANCDAMEFGSINLKYGRLNVANAYGSEYLPLKDIRLSAEYYDGTSFVHNKNDNCTRFNSGDINWEPAPATTDYFGLTNGDVIATGSGILVGGLGMFTIHNPSDINLGPGETGYVNYDFPTEDWLNFNWSGSGDSEPRPRASFGLYNRSKRLIYTREVY